MSEVSLILAAVERGDAHAAAELLPLVYEELRRLATQRLAGEKPGRPPCHLPVVGRDEPIAPGSPRVERFAVRPLTSCPAPAP